MAERRGRNVMVSTFRAPDEYERARLEAERRAALAQMLEAQAYEPLDIRQPAPIAPSQGLAKVLKSYLGAYEKRKAREAEEKAKGEEQETAEQIMGRLMGRELPEFEPDEEIRAANQAAEAERIAGIRADIEPSIARQRETGQLEEVMPTAQYTRDPMEALRLAGTPAGQGALQRNQVLAGLLARSVEQPAQEEFYAPVVGEGGKYVQFGKRGGTQASDIAAPAPAPAAVTTATIMKDGKPTVIDARTGNVIGAAVPTAAREERLVSVMGPQGPTYVRESEAVGMKPFTAQTLKQEQTEAAEEERKRSTSTSTQITLDNAAALLTHPGREAGTGASDWKSNIPGTDARDFKALLDTLKAQTFIPMVSALRGLGALSDAEGKRLLDAVGALDTGMSEEGFYNSLEKVINEIYTKAEGAGLRVTRPLLPPNPYKKSTPAATQSSVMDEADAILGGG